MPLLGRPLHSQLGGAVKLSLLCSLMRTMLLNRSQDWSSA